MHEVVVEQSRYEVVVGEAPIGPVVRVREVVVAVVGTRGPSGPRGLPGVGGALAVEEFEAEGSGEIVYELAHMPMTVALYINGLRQRSTSFSVAGQEVTLPADLEIAAGDSLTLEYVYEV